MRRIIVTVGGLAMAGLFSACAPAYVESRPAYVQPAYAPEYGSRHEYKEERRERHEAREHERREWRVPEDGD